LDQNPSGDDQNIIPYRNGFVDTVAKGYCDHNALVMRPDDVWLTILTQFNFFVNGNAEQLRTQFVGHEGKDLSVTAIGSRYTVDFGLMSRQMTELMNENMPNFSTTTITDTTVCSMVMMGTMTVSRHYATHYPI
jgi:hypothetical protein